MKLQKIFSGSRIRLFSFGILLRKPRFTARVAFNYARQLIFTNENVLRGVAFATTYKCNFHCSHCYAERFRQTTEPAITFSEKVGVLKECLQAGVVAFDFVGGEIGLSNDFDRFLPYIQPTQTYISLASNGFEISRKRVKELKKAGVDKISISIDSGSEEEHDKFRKKKGSYKRCFQAVENIKAEGLTPVIITTVCKGDTKTNEFKQLVQYALENKIQLVFSAGIPFGELEGKLDILCDKEDIANMLTLHQKHPSLLTRDLYENLGKTGCPAAKQIIYISEYGDVMPCAFTHISFGNLKYESIRDIRNRILKLEEFSNYLPVCLPAEDRPFIDKFMSQIPKSKKYPIAYKDIFKERYANAPPASYSINIPKKDRPCPFCGSRETLFVAAGREHEFDNTTHDLFCVVRCKQCDLVYLNPIPDASALDIIYPKNYYCHNETYASKRGKRSLTAPVKQLFNRYLGYPAQIRRIMKQRVRGTNETLHILDIGCGNGDVLNEFCREAGGKIVTYGLDYSKQALQLVAEKGHQTIEANIDTAELGESKYDIIYSSNVIEHVAQPQQMLEKVYAALKPTGLLVCETPNFDSMDAKFFGSSGHWGGFHFPRHWTFYTPETLSKSAEKAGFAIQHIKFKPVPIFWLWTMHSRLYRGKGKKVKADKRYPLIEQKSSFLRSFCLKGLFTLLDLAQLLLTRKTSLMVMYMKK